MSQETMEEQQQQQQQQQQQYQRHQRQFGIASDLSAPSKYALKWALEHFARDEDHVVVLMVRNKADRDDSDLWEKSGTPLIPLHDSGEDVLKKYSLDSDPDILAIVRQFREKKKITVDAKIYYGDAREKLIDAIPELKLDLLVVGSRGLGTVKRALLGSVSNYVMLNADCPVTVVRMPAS